MTEIETEAVETQAQEVPGESNQKGGPSDAGKGPRGTSAGGQPSGERSRAKVKPTKRYYNGVGRVLVR